MPDGAAWCHRPTRGPAGHGVVCLAADRTGPHPDAPAVSRVPEIAGKRSTPAGRAGQERDDQR
jgi:hypothetical protein